MNGHRGLLLDHFRKPIIVNVFFVFDGRNPSARQTKLALSIGDIEQILSAGRSSLLPLDQSVVKGMNASEIIDAVLRDDEPVRARTLLDASVHLPRRGRRWVASYRDESGRQVWKATGQSDREAALAIAQEWEQRAKRKRLAQGVVAAKPSIRVRPGSGEETLGLLTQAQVALILRISQRSVREIERRAFEKLRRHPALKRFWREHERGEIKEAASQPSGRWQLTQTEITAVYALARTPIERQALSKLIALTQAGSPRTFHGHQTSSQ